MPLSNLRRHALMLAVLLPTAAVGALPSFAQDEPKPAPEMQAVLDKLKALGAKPIHTVSVPEARTQATPADAAMSVMVDKKIPAAPEAKVLTKDIAIPTKNGNLAARLYIPAGDGPFPVIVYYHGGGWVIADINVYDATPRGLALATNALVVSVEYRHAPESKFPAQHEDAYAAYSWVIENIGAQNGDSSRTALVGESAGGNLAVNVALMAKQMKATMPVHQVIVYPIASNDPNTESKKMFTDTAPLATPDLDWFNGYVFASKSETADPRINLVGNPDLAGLPPATIIAAEIDPLRSESEMLADKLKAAGVTVTEKTFPGVMHEFFGMAKVVPQAKEAMDLAVSDLKQALAKK